MRFQYFSDIHLEFYNENFNKIGRIFISKLTKQQDRPRFLMLPGDIGHPKLPSYKRFLETLSPMYEKIFVTTGNHEYYKTHLTDMSNIDSKCREICESLPLKNVIFLQNEVHHIDDLTAVYGGTFWTYVPVKNQRAVQFSGINDYRYIYEFYPEHSSALHKQAVQCLQDALDTFPEKKWIVMSHHMPSFDLIDPKYRVDKYKHLNHAFASDIMQAHDPRIVAWVYGHTHSPFQKDKFYCNPIGYPGENKKWDLSKEFPVMQ